MRGVGPAVDLQRTAGPAQAVEPGIRDLAGAQEVARDQHIVPVRRQPRRDAGRLGVAGGIQRHVDLTLKTLLAVPVGLAVPDEQQFGHLASVTWRTAANGRGRT
jgi:hypothetical protein